MLTVWGLLVLLVDLGLARAASLEDRRHRVGMLSLVGVGIALALRRGGRVPRAAASCAGDRHDGALVDQRRTSRKYLLDTDPVIFFGTIAGDMQSAILQSALRRTAGPGRWPVDGVVVHRGAGASTSRFCSGRRSE